MNRDTNKEAGFLGINVDSNITPDYVYTELTGRAKNGDEASGLKLLNQSRHAEDINVRIHAQKGLGRVAPKGFTAGAQNPYFIPITGDTTFGYGKWAGKDFVKNGYCQVDEDGTVHATLTYHDSVPEFFKGQDDKYHSGNYIAFYLNRNGHTKAELQGTEGKSTWKDDDNIVFFKVNSTEVTLKLWLDGQLATELKFDKCTLEAAPDGGDD